MTDIDLSGLRRHGIDGFIFTSIKAEDTDYNEEVHTAFRAMADIECKGDRTIALAVLLRNYAQEQGYVAAFEPIWEKCKELEARIEELQAKLEAKPTKDEEDDGGAF